MQTHDKLETGGNFLNLMKNIYKNPAAIIILNGERLNFFCKIKTEGGCPYSQPLFNIVLEIVGERGTGRKEWKGKDRRGKGREGKEVEKEEKKPLICR